MYSFVALLTIVLASSSVFAAPLQRGQSLRGHMIWKRDDVCGADFRSLVSKARCLPKSDVFVLATPTGSEVIKSEQPPVCLARVFTRIRS